MPLVKGTSSVADSRALSKALKQTKFPKHFSTKVQDWNKIKRAVIINWIEQQITASLGFEDEIVSSTAVNLFLPPEDNNNALTVDINPRTAQIDLAGFLGEADAAKFASELWEMLLDASQQPTGIPRKILDAKMKELQTQQEQQKLLEQEKDKKRQEEDRMRQDRNRVDNHRTENIQSGRIVSGSKRNRWGDKRADEHSGRWNDTGRGEENHEPKTDKNSEHRWGHNAIHFNERRGEDRRVNNNFENRRGDRRGDMGSEHRRVDRNGDNKGENRWRENATERRYQNKDNNSVVDTSCTGSISNNINYRTDDKDSERDGKGTSHRTDRPNQRPEEYEYDSFGRRVRTLPQGESATNEFSRQRYDRDEPSKMRRSGDNYSERRDINYHNNYDYRDHPPYQHHYLPPVGSRYNDRGEDWYRRRPPHGVTASASHPHRGERIDRGGSSTLLSNRDRPNDRRASRSRSRSRSRSYSSRSSSRSRSTTSASTGSRDSRGRRSRRSRSQSTSSSVSSRSSASSSSSFSTRGSNSKNSK